MAVGLLWITSQDWDESAGTWVMQTGRLTVIVLLVLAHSIAGRGDAKAAGMHGQVMGKIISERLQQQLGV